jgi:hypothetical protein
METRVAVVVVCVVVVVVLRGTMPVNVVLSEEQAPVTRVNANTIAVNRQPLINLI